MATMIKKLFTADHPYSMAVTHNGNILISSSQQPKVKLYTDTGTLVQVVELPLVENISVCRITGKVAFSRRSSGVSVMNDKLEHQFTIANRTFARAATFDSAGHLLIVQSSNDKIHIVDATTGKALKSIHLGHGYPCSLVSYNDTMMVCTSSPDQLLSIKYLY